MDDVPRINGTPWAWEMSDDDLSNAGFPVIKTDMMLGSRVVCPSVSDMVRVTPPER